eukprot:759529-Hanusia_phi.AAC.11
MNYEQGQLSETSKGGGDMRGSETSKGGGDMRGRDLGKVDGSPGQVPRNVSARRPPLETSAERQAELRSLDVSAQRREDGRRDRGGKRG